MHWQYCTGCTCHNVCSTKSRCFHFTMVHCNICDLLSPIRLVGELCVQQVPAAHSCHPSNCLLLAAVPFRLPQLKSGTVCQRPLSHCHHCRLSVI